MKIAICGPPRSGKSCLRYGLKEAIKSITGAPYPYVITACPDGEGSWFHESSWSQAQLAAGLKAEHKAEYTEEHANLYEASVQNCQLPLVVVDVGGIPDDKNERICRHCTDAILIFGDNRLLPDWQKFCSKIKLNVFAEIKSDHGASSDQPLSLGADAVYRGAIHFLERGDLTIKERPTIVELAQQIVAENKKRRGLNASI